MGDLFVSGLSANGNPVHHYNLLNRVQTLSTIHEKFQLPVSARREHPIDIHHHRHSHPFEHDSQD
jgi:hypothetical protein